MKGIIEGIRWGSSQTNRTDKFKIGNNHAAFYARHLQMADPSLCGLFAMQASLADDLILDDGRTWVAFAKEHVAELRFVAPPDAEDVSDDWSY
jgi:hypothetical protein